MKKEKMILQKTSKMQEKEIGKEKGVTLITLVTTIIVLMILATVSLNVALGEGGLIDRAKQVRNLTEQAVLDEQQSVNKIFSEYANIMTEGQTPIPIPEEKSEVAEAIENGTKYTDTKPVKDDLKNTVYIPGGFHLAKDSGTKVEEGIVIEDDNRNQFVWIPTGTYNVTKEVEKITEPDEQDGKLTNELSRRTFTESESTTVSGDTAITSNYYGEGDSRSCTIVDGVNSIDAFLLNAKPVSEGGKGGFYIGRYEQGTGNVCKAGVDVYTNIARDIAKSQAETMYSGKTEIKATSQLISSYAWDTALNFICQTNKEGYMLATTNDNIYGNFETGERRQTGQYKVDGVELDKYSNIYDLLGNCCEWTTEYSDAAIGMIKRPYIDRGGSYKNYRGFNAASRTTDRSPSDDISFRIQLYV